MAAGETAGRVSIDHHSPVPKYSQLREILLDLVETELAADQSIPSERELSARFGLSRMTVRQSVDHLVSEGRLYRVQGKGTFVARPKIEMPLRLGDKLAPLVGAGPGEIAVTDTTSLNLFKVLAAALRIQADKPARKTIVTERANFPTDVYIAEGLATLLGPSRLSLRYAAAEDVASALDESVAAVAFSHRIAAAEAGSASPARPRRAAAGAIRRK